MTCIRIALALSILSSALLAATPAHTQAARNSLAHSAAAPPWTSAYTIATDGASVTPYDFLDTAGRRHASFEVSFTQYPNTNVVYRIDILPNEDTAHRFDEDYLRAALDDVSASNAHGAARREGDSWAVSAQLIGNCRIEVGGRQGTLVYAVETYQRLDQTCAATAPAMEATLAALLPLLGAMGHAMTPINPEQLPADAHPDRTILDPNIGRYLAPPGVAGGTIHLVSGGPAGFSTPSADSFAAEYHYATIITRSPDISAYVRAQYKYNPLALAFVVGQDRAAADGTTYTVRTGYGSAASAQSAGYDAVKTWDDPHSGGYGVGTPIYNPFYGWIVISRYRTSVVRGVLLRTRHEERTSNGSWTQQPYCVAVVGTTVGRTAIEVAVGRLYGSCSSAQVRAVAVALWLRARAK